jgi:hypothetical protein
VRPRLAKGEVAAENDESRGAEPICQGDEERRVAVRPCAVGQDEAIVCRINRAVQMAANRYFIQKVEKLLIASHMHRLLQPRR